MFTKFNNGITSGQNLSEKKPPIGRGRQTLLPRNDTTLLSSMREGTEVPSASPWLKQAHSVLCLTPCITANFSTMGEKLVLGDSKEKASRALWLWAIWLSPQLPSQFPLLTPSASPLTGPRGECHRRHTPIARVWVLHPLAFPEPFFCRRVNPTVWFAVLDGQGQGGAGGHCSVPRRRTTHKFLQHKPHVHKYPRPTRTPCLLLLHSH